MRIVTYTDRETGMEPTQIYQLMQPEELACLQVDAMSDEQRSMLLQWLVRMIMQTNHKTGDIDSIKYDGRLIILEDGSRWEVDESDSCISETWSEMDRVVVIDGEMFRLDETEKIVVEEEI